MGKNVDVETEVVYSISEVEESGETRDIRFLGGMGVNTRSLGSFSSQKQ